MKVAGHRPIIFFDGYCNLCNSSVRFLIRHGRSDTILFASLQSPVAHKILGTEAAEGDPETVVLLLDGTEHRMSDAIVRVAAFLRWPWRILV